MELNRRGFFSSLAGVVAWSKLKLSLSPAARAVPPAYSIDVYSQMDGSNTIDTIVSVADGGLTVNNASMFRHHRRA